jgi:hypothetical protein
MRSNGVIVRQATPEEVLSWDELIARFPNHRVFHKKTWLESLQAFSGAKPLYLMFEKEGALAAMLPGFLTKVAGLNLFVSPREGWQTGSMGIASLAEISPAETLAGLIPYLEGRHRVQHIEMICRGQDTRDISSLGFSVEEMETQTVQLLPGPEEVTLKHLPQKTRNQLRKAQKMGLVARIAEQESFVDEFYTQAQLVFTRNRHAIPFARNRVLQLFRFMRSSGNLLPISVHLPQNDACIATGLFLANGREMFLWGWAHRQEYGSLCPMELLTWTAMRAGIASGFTSLDMAGGGKAKEKYGALPDHGTTRWLRSRYGWLTWLRASAKRGYRWQQSMRGRLRASLAGMQRNRASASAKTPVP